MKQTITIILILSIVTVFSQLKSQELNQDLTDYFTENSKAPEQYILDKFKTYDVILLGEAHLIRENLIFVQSLISHLHKNGIYNLGMEFGANEHQHLMDSLTTAEDFDDDLAQKMMFDYNVAGGYKEYIDIAKAAWRFNSKLSAGEKSFRVLNLSYVYDWEQFNGVRNTETMERVFHRGTPDKFRAEVIEEEVLRDDEKVLALVGTPHAYTKYGSPYFLFNADNFCGYDYNWLGNRLYLKYPDKVYNIILHQPFRKKTDGEYILISPLDGAIERLMDLNDNQPAGFDLIGSPVGKLRDQSIHSLCYEDFRIEQLFDGYIFLEALSDLEGCTPVDGFVNESNIDQALKQFPDPDWHPEISNLPEMIEFIKSNPQKITAEYSGF